MQKRLFMLTLILTAMLLVAACGSAPENDTPADTPPDATQPQDFAGQTLSISVTDFTYYELLTYVEKFKAAYPGVEIVLNRNSYAIEEWYKYGQQAGTQIMAGAADDIVDASGLDYRKLSESGLLADFYPLMQNDPDFNEEDYYMNVFDAMSYKGKLTMFPTSFYYNVVGINNRFSEQVAEQFSSYETVSLRQMLDLYNNLENKDGRYLFSAGDSKAVFFDAVLSFIDFENRKCYFNTPEFIQLLTDFNNSTSSKLSTYFKLEMGSLDDLDVPPILDKPGILEEYALQYLFQPFDDFIYRLYLMFLPESQKQIFTHFIPVTTDANELIIIPGSSYSINEASQNKALAWEFIKFLTTPEANENVVLPIMPINRAVVKAFAPSNLAFFINQYQSVGFGMDGEAADVITQVMTELEPYSELPMKCYRQGKSIDWEFYMDDIITFLDGALTAEQAASAIQNKVSLYLME